MSDTYFLIVGIVLAIIGGLIFFTTISNACSCSRKVMGKVVRVSRDNTRNLRGTYPHYPVVSYTADGKEYIARIPVSARNIKWGRK